MPGNLANLIERLKLHEQQLNDLNTQNSSALLAKNPSDKKTLQKFKRKCYYCEKLGILKSSCFSIKKSKN